MRKFFLLIFSVTFYTINNAQVLVAKKVLDSISASQWQKQVPNLDSLAEVSLVKIPFNKVDSIILKPADKRSDNLEVPLTPFQFIKTPQTKNWFFYGQNNLVFNQSSFSNWNSGGNNNIGIIGKVNYNISYKKGKHFLENNFMLGYGFVAASGQSTRKTEDYINIFSNYGYDLGKNYYLSMGFQFLSQFAPGYNYSNTPDPGFGDRVSNFLAPAYFNIGMGISYNPVENFQIIVRPINGKFTIVGDEHLQRKGLYGLEHDGQKIRKELGAMVNVLYRLKIYKDISLTNTLNLFSNYAFHPERVDIRYNALLNFKLNKLISTNVTLDLLYDHYQIKRLQMKQTLGIGFAYNLGNENKEKPKKKVPTPFVN